MKDAHDEILELLKKSSAPFADAILELARAEAGVSESRRRLAMRELGVLFRNTLGLSDLLGRRRLELSAKGRTRNSLRDRSTDLVDTFGGGGPILFAANSPVVPHVEFEEAVADIVSRTPELASSWEEVAKVYEKHGFALAKSTSLVTTTKVADTLKRLLKDGIDLATGPKRIQAIGGALHDWSLGYAENVQRTNMSRAYTAGRFRHATDPDVAKVIGALEYNAVGDSRTRRGRPKEDRGENHLAADGILAHPRDGIWNGYSPPLGYRCLCGLREIDRWELEERGLLRGSTVIRVLPATFSQVVKTPGFGNRPDLEIYGRAG